MTKRKRYLEKFDKKLNKCIRVPLDSEEVNEELLMIYDFMEAQMDIELRKQEMLIEQEKKH